MQIYILAVVCARGAFGAGRPRGRILPVHRLHRGQRPAKEHRPIPVCVIEYLLISDNETGEFRVVTTILDLDAARAGEPEEAYARLWEIDSCFDELETHQCGPSLVFRSQTIDRVRP